MKIYRVIYKSLYMDGGESFTEVKTFLNKENALRFMRKQIVEIKKQVDDLDVYYVDENEISYERYLVGRSFEDSVSIYLEDDETYDEKFLQEEQTLENEKDNDYEMQ